MRRTTVERTPLSTDWAAVGKHINNAGELGLHVARTCAGGCATTCLTGSGLFFCFFFVWLSAQVVPYNQRISLLLYKMREAVNALGNQQHALALGYAASTMHDVAALHK